MSESGQEEERQRATGAERRRRRMRTEEMSVRDAAHDISADSQ